MADLSDKISEFLSDPQKLGMISQMLEGIGDKSDEPESDSDDILSLLSDIDVDMIKTMTRLMKKLKSNNNKDAQLLMALKPIVNSSREQSIDEAIRIVKIIGIVKEVMQDKDIFKGGRGLV